MTAGSMKVKGKLISSEQKKKATADAYRLRKAENRLAFANAGLKKAFDQVLKREEELSAVKLEIAQGAE